MVTQQRKDLLMHIPALRKLDAMLIVRFSHLLPLWRNSSYWFACWKNVAINRTAWIISKTTMNFGTSQATPMILRKVSRGMINGGCQQSRFLLVAYQMHRANGCNIKRIASTKGSKHPWPLMLRSYERWRPQTTTLNLSPRYKRRNQKSRPSPNL